ncbi:MAG: hypothetical protein WD200_01480 [Candidatus Andersenbacteria bacterium]
MSFGGFIFGIFLMGIGFLAVYKTYWFEQNLGDVGAVFGINDQPWMSWKFFGIVLMLIGFLVAFGLLSFFFQVTIGRFFNFGA